MPWQRLVADVGGELDEAGNPVYRDVVVLVPRQSGKTTITACWEIQRAIGWTHLGPQRIAYSAQTGNDARKKLLEDQLPLLERHSKLLGIRRLLRGMGNEAVEFANGSRIVLLASTAESGHGKTLHLGVKDELFADADDRRDQAIIPAMNTVRSAQVLTTSTMGTDASVALNAAVERGRAAVDRGATSGTAYFEWSALPDDDPDDESVWWGCMPALGFTIDLAAVRHARSVLSLAEFRRAYLNIMDGRRGEPAIPPDRWRACARPSARVPALRAWSLDVTPDRAMGSVAVGGRDSERSFGEVVEHRPGTAWMAGRAKELLDRHGGMLVMDAAGPASSLLPALQELGIEPRLMTTREAAQACGGFYDSVVEGSFTHIDQAPLNAAVDGADWRIVADSRLWSRRSSSVDISPLVAVTNARWGVFLPDELPPITQANPGVY